MKIEAGKCYRARDGRKIGPMAPVDGYFVDENYGYHYAEDGRSGYHGVPDSERDELHAVAEWADAASVDLTKITTPFGLLDPETQEALRAHGGPYEYWTADNGWFEVKQPSWGMANAYRVRPAREWWIHLGREAVSEYHPNPDSYFKDNGYIHVREVLE